MSDLNKTMVHLFTHRDTKTHFMHTTNCFNYQFFSFISILPAAAFCTKHLQLFKYLFLLNNIGKLV